MVRIRERLVLNVHGEEDACCCVCTEPTIKTTDCCRAPVCRTCYERWLQERRQCFHCRRDQCGFETWMNHFRKERLTCPHCGQTHSFSDDGGDATVGSERAFSEALARAHIFHTLRQSAQRVTNENQSLSEALHREFENSVRDYLSWLREHASAPSLGLYLDRTGQRLRTGRLRHEAERGSLLPPASGPYAIDPNFTLRLLAGERPEWRPVAPWFDPERLV